LSFEFHAAIASLSSLEWKNREILWRPLRFDLLLDFCDGPAIKIMVSGGTGDVYRWFNPRRQLVYRVAHRLAELVQLLSAHSPFERFADISAR
jgi:hypothetical protein